MTLRIARVCALIIVPVTLSIPSFTLAQSLGTEAPQCEIKNFGRVSDSIFRGAQPRAKDYPVLAKMGVKTVIDLQREGDSKEQGLVEAAGMKFFRVPMSDTDYPKQEQIERALQLVSDTANQPVFVHCAGGRHRTGAVIAMYRMTHEGWDFDHVFAEMKQYDFNHGFGHGAIKDYVYDQYVQGSQVVSAGASPANSSNK
ncbi:MAG TPA: dual specificity protein phosphatase family protein [Blastocatellia bacterium]|nr:dual specificity protein phosphatase family protein [Blastocatellia bacterium]